MQNFRALGALPPDPRASGGWGLCPYTTSLRQLGASPPDTHWPPAAIPDPQNSPPIANFWLRAWCHEAGAPAGGGRGCICPPWKLRCQVFFCLNSQNKSKYLSKLRKQPFLELFYRFCLGAEGGGKRNRIAHFT